MKKKTIKFILMANGDYFDLIASKFYHEGGDMLICYKKKLNQILDQILLILNQEEIMQEEDFSLTLEGVYILLEE